MASQFQPNNPKAAAGGQPVGASAPSVLGADATKGIDFSAVRQPIARDGKPQ